MMSKNIIDDYMETYVRNFTTYTEIELEEIYKRVFGEDAINRYTHDELITMLDEMYKCYQYVVDNIYNKGKMLWVIMNILYTRIYKET